MSEVTANHFCPSCGSPVKPAHKFCRKCGSSLIEEPEAEGAAAETAVSAVGTAAPSGQPDEERGKAPEEGQLHENGALPPPEAAASQGETGGQGGVGAWIRGTAHNSRARLKSLSRRTIVIFAVVLAAVVAAIVLFATGVLGGDGGKSEARQAFPSAMQLRRSLILSDYEYRQAMNPARSALRRYAAALKAQKDEIKRIDTANKPLWDICGGSSNIACPSTDYPDSPKAPNLGDEIRALREVGQEMSGLGAKVRAVVPPSALDPFYKQLSAAIEQLEQDATYNADTLTKAVDPADRDSSGEVDASAVKTLKYETALPSIKALNAEAVRLIQWLDLNIKNYDVPGGDDQNPKDASVAT